MKMSLNTFSWKSWSYLLLSLHNFEEEVTSIDKQLKEMKGCLAFCTRLNKMRIFLGTNNSNKTSW